MDLGASRIGGIPDLPGGERWPERDGRPMAFLAQFRLEDVAAHDTEKVLPSSGTMYFFYDAKEQPWGSSGDEGGWKIVRTTAPATALERRQLPPNLSEECRFTARAVRFSAEVTVPPYEHPLVLSLQMRDDERDAYAELLGELGIEATARHRFLGYPDVIQNEMEPECERESRHPYYSIYPAGEREARMLELAERAKQWRLLFQLDTDDDAGMMWGDTGRLYFWIREDSLKAGKWGEAWLILQCC